MSDTAVRRRCKRCEDGVAHEWTHGTATGFMYHGCRCEQCKRRMREDSVASYWKNRERELENKRRYRQRNLEVCRQRERAKRNKPETRATVARRKAKLSRVPVTRTGRWMPHEEVLVLRDDLTILELAYRLERSPSSVQGKRNFLRDPEAIRERNRRWRTENHEALTVWRRARYHQKPRSRQEHCKRGHPFDDANTYVSPDGERHCRACRLIRRPLKGRPAKPTHCPQGHPYSGDNVRVYGNGYQRCKECDRQKHRKNRCKNGHELAGENINLIKSADGRVEIRRCVTCAEMHSKTHCPAGHEYNPTNSFVNVNGARCCRLCARQRQRERRQRERLARPVGEGICRVCGEVFTYPRRGGYPPQYCSDSCRHQRQKAG